MTERERAYWNLKLRLLLSEAAEIKRMLEGDPAAQSGTPVVGPIAKTVAKPSAQPLTQTVARGTIPQ